MTLKELKDKHFPKVKFLPKCLKVAGAYLKKSEDKAIEYLNQCVEKYGEDPPDFKPPAKCFVIAQSRDFSEFEIVQASNAIQDKIYNSTYDQIKKWQGKTDNSIYEKSLQRKEEHQLWFDETGVKVNYSSAQPLNLIFSNALSTFEGVITKIKNKNLKKAKKAKARGFKFVEEPALDDNGCLLQKPGINPNLFCVQQFKVKALTLDDFQELLSKHANRLEHLKEYSYSPTAPIPVQGYKNRIKIPKDQPGYIPLHQRAGLNPKKRSRRYFCSKQEKYKYALLVKISIGDDWVLCDARGLLRNVRYRKLAKKDITLNELMELFTKDPVIDTSTGVVSFSYVAGTVPVRSLKPVFGKQTKTVIENAIQKNDVCIAAIDLGVINPYAVGVFKVGKDLKLNKCGGFGTLQQHKKYFELYRAKKDALEEGLKLEALSQLSTEYKKEFNKQNNDCPSSVKTRLILKLGILDVNWDDMNDYSTQISDYLISCGREDETWYCPNSKTKVKKRDIRWFKENKYQVSEEARKAFNEMLWDLKRSEPGYNKLSKRKQELSRYIINNIVRECKELSGCSVIMIAMENLNVDNREMSGRGLRENGWENFGKDKKENRWFIQALKKSLSEQSAHHGIPVLTVNKNYTSMTCPICDHCDKKNRSSENREVFKCFKCGVELHSDVDVATFNIARLALSGEKLPGPIEQSGGKRALGGARKGKKRNKNKNMLVAEG